MNEQSGPKIITPSASDEVIVQQAMAYLKRLPLLQTDTSALQCEIFYFVNEPRRQKLFELIHAEYQAFRHAVLPNIFKMTPKLKAFLTERCEHYTISFFLDLKPEISDPDEALRDILKFYQTYYGEQKGNSRAISFISKRTGIVHIEHIFFAKFLE
jgi:hypothetical protein